MPCRRAVRNHKQINIPKVQYTAPGTEEGFLFLWGKSSHRDRLVLLFHHVGEEQKPKDFSGILLVTAISQLEFCGGNPRKQSDPLSHSTSWF